MDPLSKQFRIVYYDHRGNGRSNGRDELANVDHSTWAEDLDALRVQLGFDTFILVGHSYGGVLGQEYALRYQQYLSGLVLMTTLSSWDYRKVILDNAAARGTPEQVEAVKGMFTHVPDAESFAKLAETITLLYFKRVNMETMAGIGDTAKLSYQAYNQSFVECLPKFNTLSQLKEITVPTLVIAGRDDWIAPVEQSERIHALLSNSKLVVFEENGHFPFIEEHKRYLQVLGDWIAKLK